MTNHDHRNRPLVYFAAPLFSSAELAYNLRLTVLLEEHVDVYLPQRDGGKVVDLLARGVARAAAYRSIYERDIEALRGSDALIILLDGRAIDEGAAFELGFAIAIGKPCVGLQTDPRRLLVHGNNPMVEVPLTRLFGHESDAVAWASELSRLLPESSCPSLSS